MAKFKLEITCNNDAFGDNLASVSDEVSSILEDVSGLVGWNRLKHGEQVPLADTNGNKVGFYVLEA